MTFINSSPEKEAGKNMINSELKIISFLLKLFEKYKHFSLFY